MLSSIFAASILMVTGAQAAELLGYLENWVDVNWWDNNIPGNCVMGCFQPQAYINAITPYSSLNYGFTFLTQTPNPDQTGCTALSGNLTAPGPCPVWDGNAIYLAKASSAGSHAIDQSTTAATPGIIAIAEAARIAHMHPNGPKRFKICLGGWSDFARVGTLANAKSLAALVAKLVLWTFADGVDLDFEHLTPFAQFSGDDEFGAFNTLITSLRSELDAVAAQWTTFATARQTELRAEYAALPSWQQPQMAPYYNSTINYLNEVIKNGPNHLEISWTTRFNAFVPSNDVWSYLLPTSVVPTDHFETDNEGVNIYPVSGQAIDVVNIMVYDAGTPQGPLQINFTTVLTNFVTLGKVPASKINVGFEPGEQAAGGVWEGMAYDEEVATYVAQNDFGGCMIWAVNPSPATNPQGAVLAPQLANNLNTILKPSWRWGPTPTYTKCNPTSGWWPGL